MTTWNDIAPTTIEDGPELKEAIFNYIPNDRAINSTAEKANFWWKVDPHRVLHFLPRDATEGPRITKDDMLQDSVDVEISNPKYRNRQWIRGGQDKTAEQVETKRGDGDSRDFALGFRVAEQPEIEISENGGDFQGQEVGIKGIDDGKDWYWNKGDETITQDDKHSPLDTDDKLRATYRGIVDIVIRTGDPPEEQERMEVEGIGTGIVENVDDDPELESRDAAFELGNTKLEKYGRITKKLKFETRRLDLEPGQLIKVTLDEYEFENTELLIQDVDIFEVGDELRTRVKALRGPTEDSWTKFFSGLSERAEAAIVRENIDEDETLVLLFEYEKDWQETERPNIFHEKRPLPGSEWNEYESDTWNDINDTNTWEDVAFDNDNIFPGSGLYPMFQKQDRILYVEWKVDGEVGGRKQMTIREGIETDEIYTMVNIAPFEALGNVDELHWYGGFRATQEQGTGVKVATETPDQEKTNIEMWQVDRTDRKDW